MTYHYQYQLLTNYNFQFLNNITGFFHLIKLLSNMLIKYDFPNKF